VAALGCWRCGSAEFSVRERASNWEGRLPGDAALVGLLLLFGLLLTLPFSGPSVDWTPDGLYYEAQKREVQGESQSQARHEVFASDLAREPKRAEADLPRSLKRIEDPEWVDYSARFYRRRWTVPVLAAAVDPIFGTRSLEEVSLIGWALLAPLLYLLLRPRFSKSLSVLASAFCVLVPPLLVLAQQPGVDTWGVALVVACLIAALQVMRNGLRWLPLWIAAVLALSFTRDMTLVVLGATAWVAFRERSRLGALLTASGFLASLPAPLIFGASVQQNFAYVINNHRIPTDTSWSSIVSHYPHEIAYTLGNDALYPVQSGLLPVNLVMTIPVIAALVLLFLPSTRPDRLVTLGQGAAAGALLTLLIALNYTDLRIELAFLPALAIGLGLLGERLLGGRVGAAAAPTPASPS
jgi:hypothetical protein